MNEQCDISIKELGTPYLEPIGEFTSPLWTNPKQSTAVPIQKQKSKKQPNAQGGLVAGGKGGGGWSLESRIAN